MAIDPTPVSTPVPTVSSELETATVQLPAETLNFLRQEAEKRGVSTGDMVRIALGTQKFLSEAVESGAQLQRRGKDRTLNVSI